MSSEVQAALGTDCKGGASFYVCHDKPSKFLGCCTVDPCKTDDGICPDDDLRYSSINKYKYDDIGPQNCTSNKPEVQWYTCAETETPFIGCCSVNACSKKEGCPDDKIFAASLNDNATIAAPFLPDSAKQTDSPKSEELSKGAIGGIAAGGAVALILIVFLAWYCLRRRKASKGTPASAYEPFAGGTLHGSSPHTPHLQNGEYSPYSSLSSPYKPSPTFDQQFGSPPSWRNSHPGVTPSPYTALAGSPEASQGFMSQVNRPPGHFHEHMQYGYNGNSGTNFVQELPGSNGGYQTPKSPVNRPQSRLVEMNG